MHNYRGLSTVFKVYDGSSVDNFNSVEKMNFELNASVAAKMLGDDGTQVGVYGGPYPFNPNVRNPRIKRSSVALRATNDNKLAVDIEVVSK